MEILWVIVAIAAVVFGIRSLIHNSREVPTAPPLPSTRSAQSPSSGTTPGANVSRPSAGHTNAPPATGAKDGSYTFRPKPQNPQGRNVITFRSTASVVTQTNDLDLKDLVDALTGLSLHTNTSLYQCRRCKVYYQEPSYDVIRTQNGGRCVSCSQSELVIVIGQHGHRGQNASVNAITLANYRDHVGRVITFEGYVHNVLTSRRGTDYAVMFENASWKMGFKMIAFSKSVDNMGGSRFLYGLAGRTIRVRGLLIQHDTFGYEIIINDRSMVEILQ